MSVTFWTVLMVGFDLKGNNVNSEAAIKTIGVSIVRGMSRLKQMMQVIINADKGNIAPATFLT